MKCVICGNELKGKQRKYCCKKCAYISYLISSQDSKKQIQEMVTKLYARFQKAFNKYSGFHGNGGGFYIRVFVSACVQCGVSDIEIADAIKKDRSTICFHRNRITENESKIAKDFLFNKNYVYSSKYNGFTYGVKK